MTLEQALIRQMLNDNVQMAERLIDIGDFAMAAEALAQAIEQTHQLAALGRDAAGRDAALRRPECDVRTIDIP